MNHKFVEFIPSEIEENILYISIEYNVAKHKCACGCGEDIVTTLSPSRWKLTYDGETVSLYPSIGNWTHKCKSHYYIKNDKVIWAGSINEQQINKVIKEDKKTLEEHYKEYAKANILKDLLKKLFK